MQCALNVLQKLTYFPHNSPPCEVGTIIVCVCAKSLQLCPTLCDSMNSSPSVSSVLGISQARILERVLISYSRGASQPRNQTASLAGRFFFFFNYLIFY